MKRSIKIKIIGNLISGNTRNIVYLQNNRKLLRHIILVRLREVWLVSEELLLLLLLLLLCETGMYCI